MKFKISKRAKATTFINLNILVTYIGCWYCDDYYIIIFEYFEFLI